MERVEGKINKVNLNGETGFISSLDIDDGTTLEGDIFIDCTGFRGLLIGEALGIEFEDWTDHLPCNGAIAVQTSPLSRLFLIRGQLLTKLVGSGEYHFSTELAMVLFIVMIFWMKVVLLINYCRL